jgi:4-hydroxy-tetrahydrodipicolinate synthase
MTMTSDARVASVPQAARKEWAREHLKGVESTVRVSFAPNLIDFDEEGIRHDVREHIRSGFNSMLCTQPGLTAEEKMRFMEIAADEAQGRILLSATADDDDLDVSKAILAKAESLGFSHSILRVPSVLGESEDAIFAKYKHVIESTNLGIILFATKKPQFAHLHPSSIPLNLYRRVAALPNVVGVKVTQWLDPTMVMQVCDYLADRIFINTANLSIIPLLAKSYPIQWMGEWNIQAVQSPEQPFAVEFMDHINAGNTEKALEVYWKLAPAFQYFANLQRDFLIVGSHPWPHLKYYQWLVGGNGGIYRMVDPTAILDEAGRTAIKKAYKASGINITEGPIDEFLVGKANYAKGIRPKDFVDLPCWK